MTIMTPVSASIDEYLLRLPFDQYGRYRLIREILDAARPLLAPRLRVLDVGGLAVTRRGETILPAQLFLPADNVTVLDMPACDLPGYVHGDGRGLDFADCSFDMVVSCDALEHVPAADRPAFWGELLRVARHGVILAAPFGEPEVVAAEALLQGYIQVELGQTQPQLAEHSAYGLPQQALTAALLGDLGRAYDVYPAGDVHAWLAMMLAKHTHLFDDLDLHDQLDSYYNRFLAAAERRSPSYRMIWVVECDGRADWLAAVDAAIRPTLADPGAERAGWREVSTWLAQMHGLRLVGAQAAELAELRACLAQKDAQITALHAELSQKEAQTRDLERRAGWLAEQARASHDALAAVERGLMMRLLRRFGK
ncbi:MAG: methyltransferase domain-containing protein [Chloroflexales bacterium]